MRCQSCGRDIHKHCYTAAMAEECVPTKKMVKQGVWEWCVCLWECLCVCVSECMCVSVKGGYRNIMK